MELHILHGTKRFFVVIYEGVAHAITFVAGDLPF
jgi:hypothetical protein